MSKIKQKNKVFLIFITSAKVSTILCGFPLYRLSCQHIFILGYIFI